MKRFVWVVIVAALAAGGFAWWKLSQPPSLPEGIVSGNGRVEATQTDIATKYAGRVLEILAREGDLVKKGQVLVKMNTDEFEAQLANAQAKVKEAEASLATAAANIKQSEADIAVSRSDIDKSRSAVTLSKQNMARARRAASDEGDLQGRL